MKVLVLVASGLPAGYLGCYGNEWLPTPAIDRLAAEGIVFDQHYADHPTAVGAELAWQTGCYSLPFPAREDKSTAPEIFGRLLQRGIKTRLITDRCPPSDAGDGWDRIHPLGRLSDTDDPLKALSAATGQTLDELVPEEHWLLKLETSVLRPPWKMPEEFRHFLVDEEMSDEAFDEDEEAELAKRPLAPEDEEDQAVRALQHQFGGAVAYLDHWVASLLEDLQARQLLDQIILVITSDAGQSLGERAGDVPGVPLLHEERIHIPLLLRLPEGTEAGRRIATLTQPIDLLPTLFDIFALPAPQVHGRSLWPLVHGKAEQVREYVCAGVRHEAGAGWCLRTPDWSLVLEKRNNEERPRSRLYVKPDDRWEVNDLLHHHLDWAAHLEQMLMQFLEQARHPGPLEAPALTHHRIVEPVSPARPAPETGEGIER